MRDCCFVRIGSAYPLAKETSEKIYVLRCVLVRQKRLRRNNSSLAMKLNKIILMRTHNQQLGFFLQFEYSN